MRDNTSDQTLKKNYIQTYQFLIEEYEQIQRAETSYVPFCQRFL